MRSNDEQEYIIVINYPSYPGNIVSDTHNGMTISYNEKHFGLNYKGIVYCNVIPSGLPEEEWLDNFHAVGTRNVIRIPF